MAIPLTYNLRNLRVRAYGTVMTALSIGLVVAVFIGVTALARGLEEAFVTTGAPLNLVVLRQGSQVETSSVVRRDLLQVIKYLPGVGRGREGRGAGRPAGRRDGRGSRGRGAPRWPAAADQAVRPEQCTWRLILSDRG